MSEILTNFLEIVRLIPLRTEDICLEISSDCKYCLGLKVEETVELGHRVKSQCFRHLSPVHPCDITTKEHDHNDIKKRSVLSLCQYVHVIMFLLCRYDMLFTLET